MYVASCMAEVCMAQQQERRKLVPHLMLAAAKWGVETEMLVELGDAVIKGWNEWGKLLEVKDVQFPPFSEQLKTAPLAPGMMNVPAMSNGTAQFFKLRVLLVDDDRSMLLLLKTMLANAGHIVETARNGVEALQMVEKFEPQLIISDWMMPEMDGVTFCRKLRENPKWRNIYVFIVTAQESTEKLIEAFEAGVDDYLTKPINSRVLGARLRAGQRVIQLQEELEYDREQLRHFAEELASSNHRLQQLAMTDALTGLPNRRYAIDRLEQEWGLSRRVQRPVACMLIDVDRFKSINDTFGHKVGDEVLKHVVSALRNSARKQDVICRLGGEEFLVICPDTNGEQAWQHAERLRQNVEKMRMHTHGREIHMTISIGVSSSIEERVENPDLLMQVADRRMYAAKSAGRNRTVSQ
jgi:diguanylate cyclase (GGDEF)-like protein